MPAATSPKPYVAIARVANSRFENARHHELDPVKVRTLFAMLSEVGLRT
jgi:hypothetical protein